MTWSYPHRPKNKSRKRGKFSAPKYTRQHTTIHHRSTTNSPAKNHAQHVVFLKNLQQKHPSITPEKLTPKNPPPTPVPLPHDQ
jgi:hypothetical protein